MPRKKKTTTITEEIPDVLETPEVTEAELFPEEETLSQVLEQFGPANVRIKVSKNTLKGPAYCYSTDGDIDEDFIQAEYGGGTYACRIFIDGHFKRKVMLTIADRMNPATKPNNTTNVENLQLQMMREHNTMMARLLEKAFGGGNTTPIVELTDAMARVHTMTGGGGQRNQMDDFLKGFEMALKVNGNGGGAPDWKSELLDVARDVLKPVVPILAQQYLKPAAQPEQTGETMPQAQLTADVIRQQLALGIAWLKPKVLKNADPGLYIDLVVDNAEEYRPFIHFVLTQDFVEFARIDAELASEPYATWFKHFYDGLRSAFAPEDNVDADTGRTDGNAGNLVTHAQFGVDAKSAGSKTGA